MSDAAAPTVLHVPSPDGRRFDLVALGEVMLRLDPGEGRIATTRSFRAWEGGGEYNVARGLARCFGLRTAHRHGARGQRRRPAGRGPHAARAASTSRHVRWVPVRRRGRAVRATGSTSPSAVSGCAAPLGVSDRGHTAASQLHARRDRLGRALRRRRACAGSTPAASSRRSRRRRPGVAREAMAAAHRHGVVVSYDLNYRPSLWKRDRRPGPRAGGQPRTGPVRRRHARQRGGLRRRAGLRGRGHRPGPRRARPGSVRRHDRARGGRVSRTCAVVATTLRGARSATRNDWGAVVLGRRDPLRRPRRAPTSRSSTGSAAATRSPPGSIYGFLAGQGPARAVEYGAAHGALAMTTPGDTSMATLAEVEAAMRGGSVRVTR